LPALKKPRKMRPFVHSPHESQRPHRDLKPKQWLMEEGNTHAGGVHGDALPRLSRGVLPFADQDRPAARGGSERGTGEADAAAVGPADHLVEGHLLPLRAQEASDNAL
jgi:hypothetical protein